MLAITANVQAMTNEEFAEMMDTEFARYSDGTYTNLPYAEKMDFSASYSNGGAHVNGDLSSGILWIHPSKGQVASEFNGVEVWGYTKINGNLNVDQLYIDAESFQAAYEQLGVYNVGADAIEVTGKTVAREVISAGYGYFQDLEVTGRLSMGYDFPFTENDFVTDLGPGSADLAAKHPSMAIVAKNLKANVIQNGMNINVSESLVVDNDSVNNGIIRVDGSSDVKGKFSGSGEYWLTGRGEEQKFGDLEGFSIFAAHGTGDITLGNLDSPSGILNIEWRYKKDYYNQLSDSVQAVIDNNPTYLYPDAYQYEYQEIIDLPYFTINGDVNVGSFKAYAIGEVNGDITNNGTITREMIYSGNYSTETPGSLHLGGSYDLGGITVNGNIKTSVLAVGHHQPHTIDLEKWKETPVGGLVVNGDVTADWLFVDNGSPTTSSYDNYGEYIKVTGTAHITGDIFMGGSMDINKLIVDGTFYNAFGEYIEYPRLPAVSEEGIHGLQPPDYIASRVNELDAINIVNASNLYVGKLTNDSEQVYTQSYGTIRVTDNWFKDSTINMTGGVIDESSLGPDKNLGQNNTYNVSGGTLKVADLNFDSTVNLSQDGKIETAIESIFVNPDGDPEALNYVGLNSNQPETVKQSLTKWFTNYVPGTLRDDLQDHVNFNGGSIVVSGFGHITETQRDDLLNAFKDALFGCFKYRFSFV